MARRDDRAPLERAVAVAAGLKPGSWDSVEALALLAIESSGTPDAHRLLQAATDAAAVLQSGTWPHVRTLAVLARATRELRGV